MSTELGLKRSPANRIRVFIVDDHALVREGIRMILESQPDIEVVGEAEEGREAIAKTSQIKPDVILMDLSIPGLNGVEVTRLIKREFPEIHVLALTIYSDEEYIYQSLRAGASGYLLKRASGGELLGAVRAVAKGELFLHPVAAKKLIRDYLGREQEGAGMNAGVPGVLTEREREVLVLIAEGNSTQEIAMRLDISPKTVRRHRQNIMEKLGLKGSADLVKYAISQGLIVFTKKQF
ncbi:MAG: response regulator transcription factor [Firmicutes bacterium]|nr:response regulator transcription factor [Bacillota bacterium]